MKQLTITLPENIMVRAKLIADQEQQDIVDVVAAILDQSLPPLPSSPKWVTEKETFRRLHHHLKQQYFGQYVAILGNSLVDHDRDKVELLNRLRQQYGDQPILIRQVQEQVELIYQSRSPRLL